MRTMVALVVCASLVLAMGTIAMAEKAADSQPASIHGKIKSIDGANVTVTVKEKGVKETKEVVVATDDKTKVTIDGEAKTVADLKADMRVKVTPATGTATEIKATTKKPGKGKRGGAEG